MEAGDEEVRSHLTEMGMAVLTRLIESNRESLLASTGPLEVSAPQQSEIIRNCHEKCVGLVDDSLNGTPGPTVSVDEVSRLILDTLLILQDERPPPREQLCLGLSYGHCGKQITRVPMPWAIHLHNLDVTVRLRRPTGSYVVTTISMYPGIRLNNHARLCDVHAEMMNEMLKNVLLSIAFRDEVIDTSDEAPTGFHRNRSFTLSSISPDEDADLFVAFVDESFKFL